jgi:hypothetical protein
VFWVAALLVFGVSCAVAAWVVIREAARLSAEPPPPVFDVEEAFDWVVEHVPDDVAATLTPADVRRILDLQMEFFARRGLTGADAGGVGSSGDVVIGGRETTEYICERAQATGEAFLPEQVDAVIDTQFAYMRAIGAIGPQSQRENPPRNGGDLPPESA